MQELLGNVAGVTRLNKNSLVAIKSIPTPEDKLLTLPEKVLQFGTGVLLRGLPDYYVDQANKQGIFNGRILIVKSTAQNKADDFKEQNGLFTLCLRGWSQSKATSEDIINASISRVIDGQREWVEVLKAAGSPDMQVVFSNTTEVGIVLDKEDKLVKGKAPESFPGKLLAFLLERFEKFGGDPEGSKGLVIVPTELIQDNGSTLKKICLELARLNHLPEDFIQWLDQANDFCDSLVDRIVAGKMQPEQEEKEFIKLGYTDKLMIMSEVYGLWAIQTTGPRSRERLSFSQVNPGVIVTDNIEKYRHLKLFLLNAPHTFTCIIAQALGFQFVNQAMNDADFYGFINGLLMEEAVPAVLGADITKQEAEDFGSQVLDRFKNPFIDHRWSDISKQMTLKMGMRCLPLMRDYFEKFDRLPERMVKGFAAYLAYLKNQHGVEAAGKTTLKTSLNGNEYSLTDAKANALAGHWDKLSDEADLTAVIAAILSDANIWPEAVLKAVDRMKGLAAALAAALQKMEFGNRIQL